MAAIPLPVVVCIIAFATDSTTQPIAVEVTGNTFFSTKYLTADHAIFESRQDVEALISDMLRKYTDAGFAFCRIYSKEDSANHPTKKIILEVHEGDRVTVTDYLFIARGGTDASSLRRVARLRTNRLFSSRDIERAKNRLLHTGVFASIKERIVKYENGYYVVFDLVENRNDYISGSGSFARDNFEYSIWLHSINIFGTMRRIQFAYESNFPEEAARSKKLFLIDFTDPVILAPVNINADFRIATHDTIRLTELKGKLTAPLYDFISTALSTGIEAVSHISDTIQSSHTNTVLGIGLELDYSALRWSTYHNLEFDYLFRNYDRSRVKYDGAFVFASIHLKPHYRRVETEQLDYFDHFRLGGSKDIRGYLEEEFMVTRACWLNIEFKRYPIFPFIDAAWLKPGKGYLFSYGLGIEATTTIASASLVFAWPRDGTWYDGKVHFVLEKSL